MHNNVNGDVSVRLAYDLIVSSNLLKKMVGIIYSNGPGTYRSNSSVLYGFAQRIASVLGTIFRRRVGLVQAVVVSAKWI